MAPVQQEPPVATVDATDSLNLRIDGLYLTQATQRYDGSVPLVAGRDAYLRVFGLANRAVRARVTVQALLYHDRFLVATFALEPGMDSVPTTIDQGNLRASWNVMVPGRLIAPGLRVLARIDAGDGVVESSLDDNVFPAGGVPGPVPVRAISPFRVRFVPVVHQGSGLTGSISASSAAKFLADARVLLPVSEIQSEVREPFTSFAPALMPDNANGAWGVLLSEILALKQTDRESRYYYGVVKTPYSQGIAGIGSVGGAARVAVGWDRLPSGSYVMAHELAHNMGRGHAPCGAVASADPDFPYDGGRIGAWGFDPVWRTIKKPSLWVDLTGYCNPYWVSDYSWEAMLAYRRTGPEASPPPSDRRPGVLLWGRVTPQGAVLEPAFDLSEGAELPAPGPYRIEGRDAGGAVLFRIPFAAQPVADLPGGPQEFFALVLPISDLIDRIEELRLVAGGHLAIQRTGPRQNAGPIPTHHRVGDSRTMTWNATDYPMVMLRSGATGAVLGFARGGAVQVPALPGSVDLVFSDGVRSRRSQR